MATFPTTWASCQPPFGVVPRQRHTTWRTVFGLAFLHCLLKQKPCPNNWSRLRTVALTELLLEGHSTNPVLDFHYAGPRGFS